MRASASAAHVASPPTVADVLIPREEEPGAQCLAVDVKRVTIHSVAATTGGWPSSRHAGALAGEGVMDKILGAANKVDKDLTASSIIAPNIVLAFVFESGGRLNAGGKELLGLIAKEDAARMLARRSLPVGTVLTGDEERDAHRLRALLMYKYRTRLSIVLHRWNAKILSWRILDAKRQTLYGDARTPPPSGGLPMAAARALASAERATAGGYPPTSSDGRINRSLPFSGGSLGVVPPSAARDGAHPA